MTMMQHVLYDMVIKEGGDKMEKKSLIEGVKRDSIAVFMHADD
jgi:hypothetical protein